MVSVEEAAAMAMALPGVEEGASWGNRNFSVGGRAFAWVRPFSKADLKRFGSDPPPATGPILAITMADLMEKEAALSANPKDFFTIEHFNGYPAILVRLDTVSKPVLRATLKEAHRMCAAAPPKKPKTPKTKAKSSSRKSK